MKMLKKTLCVFLSILMLFSALSVSLVAFAEDISYRALAYSFFKYRTDNSGFTSVYVVETDENGFPVTSIVGDMDHYELSNSSDEYKYADDNEKPIRAISYEHKVTAKDNSAGIIRNAAREYLSIVDKLMSTEYGVGLYTIPMIAEEVANALMFTKGDDGNYLFLDGYTYVEDAVGKIVGRSPEKTYQVVDGEVEDLDVSDSWMREYGEGYNFITLYEYCNVATIIDYFSGNCTSVNSGSWFHSYSFSCYTDVDTVLRTENLVNQPLTVRYLTVEWSMERQFDDAGITPQYYNGGYIITEDRTSTDNIRRDLVSMQTAFNGYFQRYYADGFLKNVKNQDLINEHYDAIMEHFELFDSLSNAAKLAVFGQSAYSYMHLATQLAPIANPNDPDDYSYWPKHTYEKYKDNNGNNEVYQVDADKVTSIVSTIDSLLTNDKLGGIIKSFLTLSDPIKAQQAKTPKDVLYLFISDMLFQDDIINMLLEMLYPMVSELLDDMLTDQFINETLEDLWSGLDDIVDFVVNQGAGWQATIYAALASIGVTLTPAGMAYVWHKYGYLEDQYGYTTTFPEFRNIYEHLKNANGGISSSGDHSTVHGGVTYNAIGSENDGYRLQRWKDVDFSKIVWGINGDKDKFLKALDAILAPLAPLLGVLLGDTDSEIKVADVLLTPLTLVLNDSSITHNLYNSVLLPVFEVLGINKEDHGLLSGEEFESAADAIRSDGSRRPDTISNFLNNGILNPLLNWVTETVLADPISTVLSLLPNLSYFLTSGAVLNAVNGIKIPIRISHAIMFGAKATVYTLELGELLGDDTIGFLDSVQGIIELIGIDVDTGIPIVGYHAEGEAGVYKPGMALYNPDIHNIPVSEAYISASGDMSLYQDTTEFTTKISGMNANGELTEYAVRNEIGWKNWKGEVVTERNEEQMITFAEAVKEYYEYTVTTDEGEVTYKVAAKENLPQDILDSGDYSYVCDVVTLSEEAALPPIMDYKLQATGTLVTGPSLRYGDFVTNDGTWTNKQRKYIDMQIGGMETEGLVLLFLFRYILSALMYRPYSGSSFTSDYTLLDAFGLDDETLNDELFAGLKLKDIIDNVALHPDAALAALLELLYKNEFGSLYKVVNGQVVAGDDYTYDIYQLDYHADEILGAAEEHNDYTYGTAVLYTEKWTKDQSEYIVDNLDDIVEDVFAMLKMDGMESLGGFLEDMVAELLFTNDMLSDLAGMLYGLLADLGGDIDIMAIIDAALGVQITKQALSDALIYEFGNDAKVNGSFVDENGETVAVKSVYTKLNEDIQTSANYRNEANRALAAGNNALYEELLAKAAETEKFSEATFYQTGVVENDVIDEETGEPTGEKVEEVINLYAFDWGYNNPAIKAKYSDAEIFLRAASAILSPFAILIKFIFMGDDLMLLKSSEDSEVGLVNIPSYEVYHYAWIPLMETLGATEGLVSFRTYYEKAFAGESEVAQNCDTIYYLVKPIIGLAENVFENPIDVVLNLIPNLLFFISIGGLNGVVNNIAHFAYVLLDILSPLVDAYPVVNSLLANIRIGEVALNLSLPLDFDFNQFVNQLLEGLLGETLSFEIENPNLVVGTQEVEKEVFVPTLDAFGNEQYDEEGNVIGEMVWTTVTEEVNAVGTLSITLPFIDFTTLCAGTVQGRMSVSGDRYLYLDTSGGADLITLIFRLVADTLFFEQNAENIANFLIGFAQLDDEQDNDDLLMEIFTYLNMKANDAGAPDIVLNIIYYLIRFLVPIADQLGSRFKRVDFSITDMFEDTDNIMDYISALMDDGGPPNETLSGFQRLIKLIQEFFNKIAEFFRALFGG